MAEEASPKRVQIPWGSIASQLCTTAITFGAVYVAATMGFEQTIRYTRFQGATDTILVLQVVRSEFAENLRVLEQFGREAEAMTWDSRIVVDRVYSLRAQAFENATYNDMYFRMGPDVIVTLRRFYDEAQDLRSYLTTNVVALAGGEGGPKIGLAGDAVKAAWSAFKPHLVQARNELLPLMEKRVAELEAIRTETFGKDVQPVPSPPPRPVPQ